MGFSVSFHQVPTPNFVDVFPIRATTTQHGEHLTEEPNLDI